MLSEKTSSKALKFSSPEGLRGLSYRCLDVEIDTDLVEFAGLRSFLSC